MFFKVKFSSNMVQHIAFFLFDVSPFRCLIFDLYVLVFNRSLFTPKLCLVFEESCWPVLETYRVL